MAARGAVDGSGVADVSPRPANGSLVTLRDTGAGVGAVGIGVPNDGTLPAASPAKGSLRDDGGAAVGGDDGCRPAKGSLTGRVGAGVGEPRPAKGSGAADCGGADVSVENGPGRASATPMLENGSWLGARGAPKTGAGVRGAGTLAGTGGNVAANDGGSETCGAGTPTAAGTVLSATAGPVKKTWLHLLQRMRTGPPASLSSGTLKRVAQRSQVIITSRL